MKLSELVRPVYHTQTVDGHALLHRRTYPEVVLSSDGQYRNYRGPGRSGACFYSRHRTGDSVLAS